MIFPAHRVREQLKKQADLTEDESRVIGQALTRQAQGVVAPEDFFFLGHRLAGSGLSLIATVGQQNQVGVSNRQTDPSEVILEFISTKNDADLYIIPPNQIAAFGLSTGLLFDVSHVLPAGSTGLFNSPAGQLITRTAAAPVGIFVGPVPAVSGRRFHFVIREGWGIALAGPVNTADKFLFEWREVDLRVR